MYGILQSQENCRSHNGGGKKSMEKEITKKIRVYGIVQGVGFRPTVSRHAGKRDGSESVY